MKAKLFYVILTVFLSMIGFSARADVLLDPSTCSVFTSGGLPNGGFIKAITCQGETSIWVATLMQWDRADICRVSSANSNYRITGTCDNYLIYRRT